MKKNTSTKNIAGLMKPQAPSVPLIRARRDGAPTSLLITAIGSPPFLVTRMAVEREKTPPSPICFSRPLAELHIVAKFVLELIHNELHRLLRSQIARLDGLDAEVVGF